MEHYLVAFDALKKIDSRLHICICILKFFVELRTSIILFLMIVILKNWKKCYLKNSRC